eukprot:Pgem_evm1s16443
MKTSERFSYACFAYIGLLQCISVHAMVTPKSIINIPLPQPVVQCQGLHALCFYSSNCKMNENQTYSTCRCDGFSGRNIVSVHAIQNQTIREATQKKCTLDKPCKVNEAPICAYMNILATKTRGENTVSTFSWEGFCDNYDPKVCKGLYANCMAASCHRIYDKTDEDTNVADEDTKFNVPDGESDGNDDIEIDEGDNDDKDTYHYECNCPVVYSTAYAGQNSCEAEYDTVNSAAFLGATHSQEGFYVAKQSCK